MSAPSPSSNTDISMDIPLIANDFIKKDILDANVLRRLYRQPMGDIGWLIDLYLDELPNYLMALRSAQQNMDGEAYMMAIHKFKGGSANLAAARLVALCKNIEVAIRQGEDENAYALLPELEDEARHFQHALEMIKNA